LTRFLDPYQKSTNCVHVSASEQRKTVIQFIKINGRGNSGSMATDKYDDV